jgi:hypothetical protein
VRNQQDGEYFKSPSRPSGSSEKNFENVSAPKSIKSIEQSDPVVAMPRELRNTAVQRRDFRGKSHT